MNGIKGQLTQQPHDDAQQDAHTLPTGFTGSGGNEHPEQGSGFLLHTSSLMRPA